MLRAHSSSIVTTSTTRSTAWRHKLDTAMDTISTNIVRGNGERQTNKYDHIMMREHQQEGGEPLSRGLSRHLQPIMDIKGEVDRRMGILATVTFLAGTFVVLGIAVCINHRRRRRSRGHHGSSQERLHPEQSILPSKGRVIDEEKVVRKAFVDENLPAKEWIVSSKNDNSLRAGDHHCHVTSNNKKGNDGEETGEHTTIAVLGDDASTTADYPAGDDSCPICLASFQKGDLISCSTDSVGQCQHLFHRDCVYAWLLEHRECPMCRRTFLPSSLEEGKDRDYYTKTTTTTAEQAPTTSRTSSGVGVLTNDEEEQQGAAVVRAETAE